LIVELFFGVVLLLGLDLIGDFLCFTDFFFGVLFFLTGENFLGDLTGLLIFFGEAVFFNRPFLIGDGLLDATLIEAFLCSIFLGDFLLGVLLANFLGDNFPVFIFLTFFLIIFGCLLRRSSFC